MINPQNLIYILPVLILLSWIVMLFSMSYISSWVEFAKEYPCPDDFQGKKYHFQSASINNLNCSNMLVMGVSEEGFYLVPMIFFRMFHKPLLIPWKEIRVDPLSFLFFKGYKLTFESLPGEKITLSKKKFDRMIRDLRELTDFQGEIVGLEKDN